MGILDKFKGKNGNGGGSERAGSSHTPRVDNGLGVLGTNGDKKLTPDDPYASVVGYYATGRTTLVAVAEELAKQYKDEGERETVFGRIKAAREAADTAAAQRIGQSLDWQNKIPR